MACVMKDDLLLPKYGGGYPGEDVHKINMPTRPIDICPRVKLGLDHMDPKP